MYGLTQPASEGDEGGMECESVCVWTATAATRVRMAQLCGVVLLVFSFCIHEKQEKEKEKEADVLTHVQRTLG